MASYSFHASHEQFPPSELLRLAIAAERAGFDAVSCSDHFHPWSDAQGQSGFAWSWLGAAMHATRVPMSVVCAPGQRYHPAIIAQAAATLGEMFPDRFVLAIGSGQALNERITGDDWPRKFERNARLRECADVMRALWAGETVSFEGRVKVREAKLYTRPVRPPLLLGAAICEDTAEWVGSWADGLITISRPYEKLRRVVERFRAGGGHGNPCYLKAQVSFSATDEQARFGAFDQWRNNILGHDALAELFLPAQFDQAAAFVKPKDLDPFVRISSDPRRHVEWLQGDASLGFNLVTIHNVNRAQDDFVRVFGEEVLPELRSLGRSA